ncbi:MULTISPECIES: nuclear transport factor 2 family protein [Bradyrhizobium]|uniref:Ketosteroid isomerase n=1 Tax=Bradyrhizobium yuanmingense TaxID=108015 RepID=A0A0R3CAW1_9BRAD|nr:MULTISPECIES: nuclear transport factor 2 family protein [Bradyrhizobium]MCA1385492.1 nuclear transport factor 2 family protein [Bradyrhizobium sp. BRP05]KRP94746.1 ketosteroid isomerase [Bradyrhizobium yuanmingense]MCA1412263.1 nuclear transport factor 2 family protein [Bradyrhizobium sp. NBAIM20]MCA1422237.1 nuclear transport factor 2 family protein [Bradyrhizobium sp. BRP23]MCA1464863.1 nuclear transport factor 2 family protein [Bradyrhizobium sp. NBAIM18]
MDRVLVDDAAPIAAIRAAVTRYAAAWQAGDRAAIAACYHDEFVLHYAGHNPLAGTHHGKAAALATLAEVARRSNRKLLAIDDVMAGPRRGAILARESFSRDGRTAELERLLVYAVREGLLSECWVYDRDQAVVDAFLAD